MNQSAATAFAKWLANDQPELFVALYRQAMPELGKGLGDFTDVLSSIGSGLETAVSNVGSFLTSSAGMTSISQLGSAYLNSQAAKSAVNLQASRAQSGLSPAPIQTIYNPATQQYEAVLTQGANTIPLSTQLRSSLMPAGLPSWAPWAIGGGALLVILLMLRR